MAEKENIIGAGGGGKGGGGGSARVAVESPNTLQSKQYARVIDLVSEGEIGGLVNGLKSVYLDDTPVQNADNTYNFTGLNIQSRVGTQAQSSILGFTAAESENNVSTEIKNSYPITRTISNTNINAARVTISVPALSYQDMTNGDLSGNTVELAIDIQNNSGGFVPQPLRYVIDKTKFSVVSGQGVMQQASDTIQLSATWTSGQSYSRWVSAYDSARVELQYRLKNTSNAWVGAEVYNFAGQWKTTQGGYTGWGYSNISYRASTTHPPTETHTFSLKLPTAQYEFRMVILSGGGTCNITSGQITVPAYTDIITGKTTSKYQRSYYIQLPAGGPWDIRVRRITADATTSNVQNKTFWDTFTEVIDAKLTYPNSALFGLEVDAQQFANIPTRGYEINGILLKIPTNYDPLLRTYSGTWNGSFKIAWSNNPAWVFYDLITNERYGLGEFIGAGQIDKWTLYNIAQYCDELVDDGFGVLEPRFTMNLYLQTREDAYRVLSNLASAFRSVLNWSAGTIMAIQDAPSDPIGLFTAANVVDGAFNYQGSSGRTRHTVALVTWNDPADGYAQKVEYVSDDEGVARYGIQQTEVVAFGCTSRGQAHRFGKAILYTERLETETVSFRTGLDGTLVYPGAIIQTHDTTRAGKRLGGRIISATTNTIELDAPVTIESGKTYEISLTLPAGTVATRLISNALGASTTITFLEALSAIPQADSIWILSISDLVPETWRVIAMAEVETTQIEITAISHRADKYDAIEKDLLLEPLPVSSLKNSTPDAPINLQIAESLYMAGLSAVAVKATLSWNQVETAVSYIVSYQFGNENPVKVQTTDTTIDIQPLQEGEYTFSVQAVNELGKKSQSNSITKTIYGKQLSPGDVENFQLSAINGAAHLTFLPSVDIDVQVGGRMVIKHANTMTGASWNNAIEISAGIAGNAASAVLPLLSGTYLAKWVDSSGNESTNATFITTNAPDLLNMNAVEEINEHPAWTGTKVNTLYFADRDGVMLDSYHLVSEMLDNISIWPKISAIGGVAHSGEYLSNQTIDLGQVATSRITAAITAEGFDTGDFIGQRVDLISLWPSISGAVINDVYVKLYIRTTEDDPNLSPLWSEWQPFMVGDWTARAYQFKVTFNSNFSTHNVVLKSLTITVDMPDKLDSANNIVSGATLKHVNYNVNFMAVKALAVTAENMQTGDYHIITNKTAAGFDIEFKNAAGAYISRTFDFIARGY